MTQKKSDKFFITQIGTDFTTRQVDVAVKSAWKKLGLNPKKKITPNIARKSAATRVHEHDPSNSGATASLVNHTEKTHAIHYQKLYKERNDLQGARNISSAYDIDPNERHETFSDVCSDDDLTPPRLVASPDLFEDHEDYSTSPPTPPTVTALPASPTVTVLPASPTVTAPPALRTVTVPTALRTVTVPTALRTVTAPPATFAASSHALEFLASESSTSGGKVFNFAKTIEIKSLFDHVINNKIVPASKNIVKEIIYNSDTDLLTKFGFEQVLAKVRDLKKKIKNKKI